MELISSVDAEVSCSEAACSVDPCARACEEAATWAAAPATCPAVTAISLATTRKVVLTRLTTRKTKTPVPQARTHSKSAIQMLREPCVAPESLAAARLRCSCCTIRADSAESDSYTGTSFTAASCAADTALPDTHSRSVSENPARAAFSWVRMVPSDCFSSSRSSNGSNWPSRAFASATFAWNFCRALSTRSGILARL